MCLYQHSNEVAEKIGLSRLHNLARAMGRNALPRDLVSFSGVRVQAKVKVKEAQGDYEAGNEVVDYKAIDRTGAPAAKGPPAATRHAAPAGFEDKPVIDEDIPFSAPALAAHGPGETGRCFGSSVAERGVGKPRDVGSTPTRSTERRSGHRVGAAIDR